MMEKVAKQGIHYWFEHIQKSFTAKMVTILNESLRRFSQRKQMITEFNASNPTMLKDAVYSSVVSSVSSTADTLTGDVTPIRDFKLDDTWPDPSKLIPLDGKISHSSTGTQCAGVIKSQKHNYAIATDLIFGNRKINVPLVIIWHNERF